MKFLFIELCSITAAIGLAVILEVGPAFAIVLASLIASISAALTSILAYRASTKAKETLQTNSEDLKAVHTAVNSTASTLAEKLSHAESALLQLTEKLAKSQAELLSSSEKVARQEGAAIAKQDAK